MNHPAGWVLQSRKRFRMTMVVTVLSVVVLAAIFLGLRVHRIVEGQLPPTAGTTADPGLVPPSTEPASSEPATEDVFPSAGPVEPIALEVVNAFLLHDLARFNTLATPDLAERIGDSPQPKGEQRGAVRVLLGGPTRQRVLVPTTTGDLVLDMVVMDGGWVAADMEYKK